jgi:GTP-binding protein HflX
VAIVGYTNAGKSTLLNKLTAAGVRAENKLFATLDPTTRRVRMRSGRELLLTDTVGFIQKLPTDLVASFRATLEEVTYADVVLHVIDGVANAAVEHARTVDEVLDELGAGRKPRVVAVNKIDLLGPTGMRRVLSELRERYDTVVPISALTGAGLDRLMQELERVAAREMVPVRLLVPYGRETVLHELRQLGEVEGSEFTGAGTHVWGRAPRASLHRFQPFSLEVSGANSRTGAR